MQVSEETSKQTLALAKLPHTHAPHLVRPLGLLSRGDDQLAEGSVEGRRLIPGQRPIIPGQDDLCDGAANTWS
jgi:hypothetical protein